MVALAQDRNTRRRPACEYTDPMAASITCHAGAIVCLNAAGNATPGATAVGLIARGIVVERAVNGATIGENSVRSRPEVGRFANSAAGDLIARAEIGDDCWIVDDQTVAKTNGGATRSIAGKILDVDAAGVWVRVGI